MIAPLPTAATTATLLAAGAQVLAAFHHWRPDDGTVALDVSLVSSEPSLLSFGTVLIVLAALPALATLATARGGPRLVSAALTGLLVLWWVALGPVGPVAAGVWLATGAVVGQLVAAALAPDHPPDP